MRYHHHPDHAFDPSSEEPADTPVVDFSKLQGTFAEQEKELNNLDRALQTFGFFYLTNHSIPQQTVDQAFQWVSTEDLT